VIFYVCTFQQLEEESIEEGGAPWEEDDTWLEAFSSTAWTTPKKIHQGMVRQPASDQTEGARQLPSDQSSEGPRQQSSDQSSEGTTGQTSEQQGGVETIPWKSPDKWLNSVPEEDWIRAGLGVCDTTTSALQTTQH
jgi:hypothetical protein